MKVEFLEPAHIEYQEAIDFYNFYTIHKNYIEILAIAHQHRKPNYWLNR